ncbi:MAG: type VI secretion system baseplate subunit TssK [Polyangiales bacterium]
MPRKPVWTEGLFVSQHHFQRLDAYHEQFVRERMRAAIHFDWGVTELTIDERALSNGQLRIVRLEGVLPDGTPISAGDGDDAIPVRPLEGAFSAQARSLDVFVALAHESETGANVDLEAKPAAPHRYVRTNTSVPDYNTGTSELQLSWARPNLRLLLGDERRDAFDAMRITQLIRSSSGAAVVRDTYVPPVMRIGSSPFIMSGLRRVLGAMTSRQRTLAESRRQRSSAAIDFQASDAAKFWLLNAINIFIPPMSHLVDQGHAHPEEAYLVLAQMIGTLCTFAVEGDPTTIPKFNFLDLGDVFEPMFARAMALLNTVIAERYVQIPLQRRDDGMYLGRVEDPNVLRYEFFLAASGSMPEPTVRDRLPKLMKIASWNQIGAILNSAINGARVEVEYRPPGALPVKPGITFFKLNRTPDFWSDIQGTGSIALYHPLEQNSTIDSHLYAVDPANI